MYCILHYLAIVLLVKNLSSRNLFPSIQMVAVRVAVLLLHNFIFHCHHWLDQRWDFDPFGLLSSFAGNIGEHWNQFILVSKIVIWETHGLLVVCFITWIVKEVKLVCRNIIQEEYLEREADTKWWKKLMALELMFQFFHDV